MKTVTSGSTSWFCLWPKNICSWVLKRSGLPLACATSSSRYAVSLNPPYPSSCSVNPAPVAKLSPVPFILALPATRSPLLTSAVAASPPISLNPNYLATNADLCPLLAQPAQVCSNWPTKALCSSTKLVHSLPAPKRSYFKRSIPPTAVASATSVSRARMYASSPPLPPLPRRNAFSPLYRLATQHNSSRSQRSRTS